MDKEENKSTRYVVEEVGTSKPETEVKEETKTLEPDNVTTSVTQEPQITKTEEVVQTKKEPEQVEVKKKESSSSIFWIVIPGMLLLGLLIGGIFAYVFGLKNISKVPETSPKEVEIIETSSPTPTSSPSASLSKYKIKILNGSGIKGEAAKVQTLLEDSNFVVLSAGNAATYDYTKTEITTKTGVDASFVASLVKALSKNYQLEDPKVSSTQTNDVTVTVGNLKAI